VSKDTLRQLLEELLQRLLDDSLPAMDQGASVVRALNVLMLKILENADPNDAFSVLLQLLRSSATLMMEMPADTVRPKLTELVMKCLWKMSKVRAHGAIWMGTPRAVDSIAGRVRVSPCDLARQAIRDNVNANKLNIDELLLDAHGTGRLHPPGRPPKRRH